MPAYTVTVQRKGETFRAVLIHHGAEPDKAAAYAKYVWWDASKIWLQPHNKKKNRRRLKSD